METILIQIESSKRELFFSLMREFSFVKKIETIDDIFLKQFYQAIEESEEDIKNGDLVLHSDMENLISLWRK